MQIVASNNNLLMTRVLDYHVPQGPLDDLRAYVGSQTSLSFDSDLYACLYLLHWVTQQWSHEGQDSFEGLSALQILQGGHHYGSQAYGKVLADVLGCLGIVSRPLRLEMDEAALETCHRAMEVWSNDLQKWFYLDPEFSVYFKHEDNFLNYGEVYDLIKAKALTPDHIFSDEAALGQMGVSIGEFKQEYYDFISHYTACISTPVQGQAYEELYLLLERQDLPNLLGRSKAMATHRGHDFYYPMNQSAMVFDLKTDHSKTLKLVAECSHNMLDFDYFEYKINTGDWHKLKGHTLESVVDQDCLSLKLRCVNARGLKGIETTTHIKKLMI